MIAHVEHVQIGQVKLASGDERLQALLGSCIGIAIIWKKKKRAALAHCLLAHLPEKTEVIGGRYVEQAIPSLIKLLGARKRDYPELEAVIAGGANMTLSHITDENKLVGKINSKLALEMIDKLDIDLKFQDIGGFEGRTILVESLEGNYQVKTIPRMSKGEGKNEIKSKAKR